MARETRRGKQERQRREFRAGQRQRAAAAEAERRRQIDRAETKKYKSLAEESDAFKRRGGWD